MAEIISIGLTSLQIGDIAVDGGMGTVLAAVGNTFEGSAVLTQEDGEKTEFFIEESDDPIETITKKGAITLEWAIVDYTPATLASVLGGTVTGVGAAAVWNAAADIPSIEKSIELISKKGVKYQIPRAKIEAKIDVKFSKKEIALVRIKATVMSPTKAGTASMMISKVA